mgnify:CR=1 FL=1
MLTHLCGSLLHSLPEPHRRQPHRAVSPDDHLLQPVLSSAEHWQGGIRGRRDIGQQWTCGFPAGNGHPPSRPLLCIPHRYCGISARSPYFPLPYRHRTPVSGCIPRIPDNCCRHPSAGPLRCQCSPPPGRSSQRPTISPRKKSRRFSPALTGRAAGTMSPTAIISRTLAGRHRPDGL